MGKKGYLSPSPPPSFIVWLLFHFSRVQNRKPRSLVFLCSETKRKRLLRRLASTWDYNTQSFFLHDYKLYSLCNSYYINWRSVSFHLTDRQCSVASTFSAQFLAQLVSRTAALNSKEKWQVLGLRQLVKQDWQDKGQREIKSGTYLLLRKSSNELTQWRNR